MKRIKIFISSVQSEFAEERAMLCYYIRTDALLGKFFEPFIFEEVPANEFPANHVYLKEVELCDIYLGLYGNLYGFEDAEGISPTEREYDLAATLHKSRLIFIKSINEERRHPKETALIRKIERDVVRKTFVDADGLRTSVYASAGNIDGSSFSVSTLPGKIIVKASAGNAVNIYSASGINIANAQSASGLTAFDLPQGVYLVKCGDSVKKVIVSD